MSNEHSQLYLSAKKVWNTVVKEEPGYPLELKLKLELHKQLLNLFQPGIYYYYVFNIFQADFDFVSPGVTNVLGYMPEEMDIHFFLDIIHPDDKPYFLQFEQRITEFFKDLPFEKISKYKMQYDLRMRTKDNRYVRLLHQAVQIDFDETNYYRTLDVDTDISHIKQDGVPSFSIIGLDGEPSYYNITETNTLTLSNTPFTPREREILKMIVENKSSKEIADRLFISLHTVSTHRKNLLKKANCKTPVELVGKALQEGWV
ncbi:MULTISPECIES: LuxR C-terminal-related transcriptional regulator [unclassified Arcicella]|uniref:LuxR C-terminal-related transcriptional regulator n=1 Tax=unclassified Arcicella TaxID=2644986 RepID=UPI0028542EDA|nr:MULTISPECIES: LuxR C-terminal-related transcriptional regulator [unclassified Arcicella]MDR6560182.1 DNA-binding CsgD family transcriptional regulator/PAS domain-containing protein [Arcicella sp. BE51]MDR6810211.1 DNA-binding CsgD family transcriptional regulator/PAS domain-containing protein [Arcicella sp. BE140]MDR6821561.1 DNA-binding CsgD family transcriptional regulator/PAS domain-containing protein [Arcicella sp. BE139]